MMVIVVIHHTVDGCEIMHQLYKCFIHLYPMISRRSSILLVQDFATIHFFVSYRCSCQAARRAGSKAGNIIPAHPTNELSMIFQRARKKNTPPTRNGWEYGWAALGKP
jgi:hypothetical protein